MNQCHVSKVSLLYITCQVNFKPAVIIWPKVVNVRTCGHFSQGGWRSVRSASRLSRAVLKLSRITEQLDVHNISHKNEQLVMVLLTVECETARWSLCRGKNTSLRLIIAHVYCWNTQKQVGQSNLMQMKLPRWSYNT